MNLQNINIPDFLNYLERNHIGNFFSLKMVYNYHLTKIKIYLFNLK